jgi:hypothetical protein
MWGSPAVKLLLGPVSLSGREKFCQCQIWQVGGILDHTQISWKQETASNSPCSKQADCHAAAVDCHYRTALIAKFAWLLPYQVEDIQ